MLTKTLLAAAALAAAGLAHAEAATYAVDPTHTFVTFEAKHFNTSTLRGRFDKKEGTVSFDKAGKSGRAEVTFDMTSVSTGVPAPSNANLSPTNLAVGASAALKKSLPFKCVSSAGTLTMNGKTQPVTLTAANFNCYDNPMLKREVCGGDFETTIQRSQWGVSYGLQYGLPDNIRLLIQIEAVKQ